MPELEPGIEDEALSIAGVDEVGRGCLFGPVLPAAVAADNAADRLRAAGLTDSQALKPSHRAGWFSD